MKVRKLKTRIAAFGLAVLMGISTLSSANAFAAEQTGSEQQTEVQASEQAVTSQKDTSVTADDITKAVSDDTFAVETSMEGIHYDAEKEDVTLVSIKDENGGEYHSDKAGTYIATYMVVPKDKSDSYTITRKVTLTDTEGQAHSEENGGEKQKSDTESEDDSDSPVQNYTDVEIETSEEDASAQAIKELKEDIEEGNVMVLSAAERATSSGSTVTLTKGRTIYYPSYIGNYLDGKGGGSGGNIDKDTGWDLDKVTIIDGGNGTKVPLPNGFYYVGGDISTGLVISDKQGDTMSASGTSMGNQFVWIPVSSEADLTRTNFDTNGQPTTDAPTSGRNVTKCSEPYANGYSTEASEYNTMKIQVLKYGGFYIGRFEADVNSTTLRTKVTTAQTVVCKKGVSPYNYVPWGKAMNDASEVEGKSGAVYLAKNFASQHNYTSVTSTLTYGCEWDAMCRYIGDSQRTTPKKDAPELTGSVSTDVSKNIYDLAGNCAEWTMEAYGTDCRVVRGGYYDLADPVSGRNNGNPTYGFDDLTDCPTTYIK